MTSREDFVTAIKKKPYPLRECSICDYLMHFYYQGDTLYYDSGCDCSRSSHMEARPDSDLDFYLDPTHGHLPKIEKFIAEVNQ